MDNLDQGTKNNISFAIYDFEFPPHELTAQLGLEPTEILIKGETRLVGKIQHKRINKENAWILKSELQSTEPLEKHLYHLLEKINPYKQNFIKVTEKYYAEFSCGIYFYEVNPGIHLDNDLLKKLAELNAHLDLDMYNLGSVN